MGTNFVSSENGLLEWDEAEGGFRVDSHLMKDQSVLLRGDLCFLVHNHFCDRHIRVLLFCFFYSLGQSLKNEVRPA